MARKVMRTIRDAREELSNETLSVRPLLSDGASKLPTAETTLRDTTNDDILLDKDDDKSIMDSRKKDENERPASSCGCRGL